MGFQRFLATLAACAVLSSPVFAGDVDDINQMFRKGDLSGALAKSNSYLAKNPKDAQARFIKGLIEADLGKTDDAIRTFTQLTQDFPELPEPYNNLAVLYASQGKYEDAKDALEMAIRTHPSYATAHENLGDIYSKMASIAYDKALQIDSKNTAAQTKLALIKEMLGAPASKVNVPKSTTAAKPAAPTASKPVAVAAAKPQPAPVAAKSGAADTQGDVELTVNRWAAAWSAQDVDTYLAFYGKGFDSQGMNRSQWESQRRFRLTNPKSIKVDIDDLQVEQVGDRATAKFRQTYTSNTLRSVDNKTLEFIRENGQWRIVRESSN